jgi:hypothetical protein
MCGLQWSFFRVCCGYAASSCTSCRRAVLFHFSLPIMWSRWLGAAIVELQRPYSGEKCLDLQGANLACMTLNPRLNLAAFQFHTTDNALYDAWGILIVVLQQPRARGASQWHLDSGGVTAVSLGRPDNRCSTTR